MLSNQIKEMFNKEELLDEVDDMIARHIEESEEEIYNSIQDLNENLTQLIKDTVNDVVESSVASAKEELNLEIKRIHEESISGFNSQNVERQKLESKVYEIRSELVKTDKSNFEKVLEIKTQLTDSMSKTMKEMRSIESSTNDSLKKIQKKIKEENEKVAERLQKMSEFNEVIDKKVKRERSDVELQLKSTFSKIDSNENKINELYEYDSIIGNILIRLLENIKLSIIWNIHEEELSTDNPYVNQSDGSVYNKKKQKDYLLEIILIC